MDDVPKALRPRHIDNEHDLSAMELLCMGVPQSNMTEREFRVRRKQLVVDAITHQPGRTIADICRDFEISTWSASQWLKQAGLSRTPQTRARRTQQLTEADFARERAVLQVLRNEPGCSYQALADRFGLHLWTVKRIAKRSGVKHRPRSSHQYHRRKMTKSEY
jgi:transposase-like protein